MISCIESTPKQRTCKDCCNCDFDPANPAKMGICQISGKTVRTHTVTKCLEWRLRDD